MALPRGRPAVVASTPAITSGRGGAEESLQVSPIRHNTPKSRVPRRLRPSANDVPGRDRDQSSSSPTVSPPRRVILPLPIRTPESSSGESPKRRPAGQQREETSQAQVAEERSQASSRISPIRATASPRRGQQQHGRQASHERSRDSSRISPIRPVSPPRRPGPASRTRPGPARGRPKKSVTITEESGSRRQPTTVIPKQSAHRKRKSVRTLV